MPTFYMQILEKSQFKIICNYIYETLDNCPYFLRRQVQLNENISTNISCVNIEYFPLLYIYFIS